MGFLNLDQVFNRVFTKADANQDKQERLRVESKTIEEKIMIDETDKNFIYYGYCKTLNGLKSDAIWKIKVLQVTGKITETKLADGDELYDNIWNNRASLTYT